MPRVLRWTLGACVLLLALVCPAAVHAYGPTAGTDGVSMDSGSAPALQHLDRSTHDSGSQSPADSDDVWDDDDNDDDDDDRECPGTRMLGHVLHSALQDVPGLCRPSRAPGDLLSPDGYTFAPRFLTDSVRRI